MSNNKKTLLSEAQIRRMMKIAGVPALGETFISNYSRFHEEEEEEAPLEEPVGEEPMPGEEDPMAAGEEPMPGEEAPVGGEEVPQEKVEAIVDAVLAGIQQETGVPLERVPAEGEAPAPEGEPMPGGEEEIAAAPDEGGEELPPEEEPVMEGGKKYKREEEETEEEEEKDEDLEEALKAAGIELTGDKKSQLVNEVARRVARRLLRESKRSK